MQSDSNKPFVIGMIVLAGLMVVGIGYAISVKRSTGTSGVYDANVSFNDAGDPMAGNESGKVVIRMFEDFQCSACRVAKTGFDHVREKYGDRVKIIWNDFPLDTVHQNARLAANAARCAEEQGKFWEFGDALYSTQPVWSEEDASKALGLFGDYAERLGLNRGVFEGCVDLKRYESKIDADVKEGLANRVDSTPTFFIGNDRFVGAMSNEQWDREIDARLVK